MRFDLTVLETSLTDILFFHNKYQSSQINKILTDLGLHILCMQEIEIENDFNEELLHLPGYNLEMEDSTKKKKYCIVYQRFGRHEFAHSYD